MIRLTRQVYLVGGGALGLGLSHRLDGQVYLLDEGEGLALVDAGSGLGQDDILANIREAGFRPERVRHVLLTHQHIDHAGGAAPLRRTLGCQVLAPAGAAEALQAADEEQTGLAAGRALGFFPAEYHLEPCPVDRQVEDGEALHLGELVLTAVATPGHGAWDMCYLGTFEGKVALFCGDLVFPGGRILVQATPGCDPDRIRDSLFKVEQLGPEALFPGHLGFCLRYGGDSIERATRAFRQGRLPPNLFDKPGPRPDPLGEHEGAGGQAGRLQA